MPLWSFSLVFSMSILDIEGFSENLFHLFFFFLFFFLIFKFFSFKLVCLLLLEGLTIFLIFFLNMFFFNLSSFFCSISVFLVCLMVLDSVFGLCLLIFSSRNSFFGSHSYTCY